MTATTNQTVELPIGGMDCNECAMHVKHAIEGVNGVRSANVLLSAEKAVVQLDPTRADIPTIRKAVESAGYSIRDPEESQQEQAAYARISKSVLTLFGVVFGAVLFIVVAGEWFGLFEKVTERVPWPVWLALILAGGYPIFRNVIRATLNRQVISHTLMTLGVIAAIVVGQWATALIVVFFMRVGEYAEQFTAERGRRALKDLTKMAPTMAHVLVDGQEQDVPVGQVRVGDTVVVRPGEQIPIDGQVVSGHATVNQAAITGESMPVEAGAGSTVYAATLASLGSIRVRVTNVGSDTTFGRVIRLVEEAEGNRADVQRIADKFSAYFLPFVVGIAVLSFAIRRDPIATAAVLVVACSCSFALATPIAILASVGAAAKRGLLVKGGKYLETLARADVLLIDKTGTLTLGKPQVTNIIALNGLSENELLALAATAERYSEHPLAEAVRVAARERNLPIEEPEHFEAIPGYGVQAKVYGHLVAVGSDRLVPDAGKSQAVIDLAAEGKTMLYVAYDGEPSGVLAAADTLRPEVPEALAQVRALGITRIELLTGDNERTAKTLADQLGVSYQANLLPEDKIRIVKEYQAKGHRVVMVGDGVNDAPALAQADVGIAMGAAGTSVAMEAAHVALMREDWLLIPDMFRIAKRTMRVVKTNIAFTCVYNLIGLSLAAVGILPPIFAAAAQSLPDLGILANSSRLLRQPGVQSLPQPRPAPGGVAREADTPEMAVHA